MVVSGDWNKIHYDKTEAVASPIGFIAVPGMLAAGLKFSCILGTKFPGHGTVYRSQSLKFRKAVLPKKRYLALVKVEDIDKESRLITLSTSIVSLDREEIYITGKAGVINFKVELA
ncbi:MAG: enoyl-CoA hydratase [Nitrospinae bacterium]|nr:enoyl-CoA hydratase [Nitrospinota bacterium]